MSSASGKIILFGEHAVVYGRPALAVPVKQVHVDVEIKDGSRAGIWIHSPSVNLNAEINALPQAHPLRATVENTLAALQIHPLKNLQINIHSTIPVASGLGSGAAVSVALIRALADYYNCLINNNLINQLAFESEKLLHGSPSGIDNTVITYAQPVYFVKNKAIQTFNIAKPFTIVIGNTGISAPTKESVADVRALWQAEPAAAEAVFDQIGEITQQAKQAIENGQPHLLGPLMDSNQLLLQQLTVSSPELERLINAAKSAGALGAKLSGGGRGGNMIALAEKQNAPAIAEALMSANAKHVIVTEVG